MYIFETGTKTGTKIGTKILGTKIGTKKKQPQPARRKAAFRNDQPGTLKQEPRRPCCPSYVSIGVRKDARRIDTTKY